jgi:uncharacterized protein (UPF0303 family)
VYTKETLEALKRAERTFVFEKFDLEDAHTLGERLWRDGQTEPKPIAIRIVLDDLIVYQAFLPGTGEENNGWMGRKCATVNRTHHCSLTAGVERELFGAREVWQSDEEHYAFKGGAFPIVVKGEYRGIITISGLPHLQDHRRLTQTLAEFLGKEPILIPVEE